MKIKIKYIAHTPLIIILFPLIDVFDTLCVVKFQCGSLFIVICSSSIVVNIVWYWRSKAHDIASCGTSRDAIYLGVPYHKLRYTILRRHLIQDQPATSPNGNEWENYLVLVWYGFNKKMGLIAPFRLRVINEFLNHARWWIIVCLTDDRQMCDIKLENQTYHKYVRHHCRQ